MNPNSQDQNNLNAPEQNPNRYDFINQYAPSTPIPTPKAPKNLKPFILSGIAFILLVAVGTVLLLVNGKSSQEKNTAATISSDLKTEVLGDVQIAYPTTWQAVNAEPLGFTTAYSDSSTSSKASIYFRKAQIMASPLTVNKFNADSQKGIATNAVSDLKTSMKSEGCTAVTVADQKQFSNSTYFGIDVSSTCQKKSASTQTVERNRFMYIGDGYLYQVRVSADENTWQTNQSLLNSMITSVTPAQQ